MGLEDDSTFSISRDSGITWTSLEFEQTNPFPVVEIDDYKNIQVRVIDKAGNEYIADTVNVVPIAKDDGVFYLNQVFAGSEVPLLNNGSPSGTKFTMTGSAQTLSILDDDELLEDNTGSNAVEGAQNRDYNAQVLMSSFNGHPEGAYIYSRGYYEVENLTSGKIAKLYQIRIDNDYSGSGVPNTHGQYWAYSDGFVVSSGDEIELLGSFRSGGNVRYVNLDTNAESSLGLTQFITDEDSSIIVDVLENDINLDNDILRIIAVDNPVMLNGVNIGLLEVVSINNKEQIKFTPNDEMDKLEEGEIQNITFSYTLSDGSLSDSASVVIRITGKYDAATVSNIDTSLEEDSSQIVASVSNVDSIIKSNTLSANNGIAVIDENGQITYTPNANFNGSDTITINFLDENNVIKDSKTIEVTIASVNDAPEANEDMFNLDKNQTLSISFEELLTNDNDLDGDSFTLSKIEGIDLSSISNNQEISINNGVLKIDIVNEIIIFTPNNDYIGNDTFDYTIKDSLGLEDTSSANLEVVDEVKVSSIVGEESSYDEGVWAYHNINLDKTTNTDTEIRISLDQTGVSASDNDINNIIQVYLNGTWTSISLDNSREATFTVPSGVDTIRTREFFLKTLDYENTETMQIQAWTTINGKDDIQSDTTNIIDNSATSFSNIAMYGGANWGGHMGNTISDP